MDRKLVEGMISLIIPAYNEPALASVVQAVRAELERLERNYEIIVIDDGSTLGSADEIRTDERVIVHRHVTNRGYGACLKQGIHLAQGQTVLTMDADGQHRPGNIHEFLKAMDQGADLAMGSRQKLIHSNLWRMPGKWLLQHVTSFLLRRRISDLNCGFRAFQTELIRRHMHLCPNGFSFSLTSTLIFVFERYNVVFIPLDVEQRIGQSSVRIADGFATLVNIFRIIMLFDPLRVLLPPSAFCMTLGMASLIFDCISFNIRQATILLLIGGMLFFFFGLLADQVASLRREMS